MEELRIVGNLRIHALSYCSYCDLKPLSPRRPPYSCPPSCATASPSALSIVASFHLCSPRTLACRPPQPSVVVARLRGCSPSTSALHTLALRLPPRPPAFRHRRLRRLSYRSSHETDAISKRCDPVELYAAESKRTRRHRRSSTRRRESLCTGTVVLKVGTAGLVGTSSRYIAPPWPRFNDASAVLA
jgi:hypothetical protein